VDPGRFRSRSRNSPFRGFRLRGEVVATMVGGRIVMRRGELVEAAGRKAGGAEVVKR
jgi:dihydroorotase